MNILYLHGLKGYLNPDKQKILEPYGKPIAPSIDYENNPDVIAWLKEKYSSENIDVIIGSSMGGFTGYHLCKILKVPALLFNPALAHRPVLQNTIATPKTNSNGISIILGGKDAVVNPKGTLEYIGNHLSDGQDLSLKILPKLEHRIPLDVFKGSVSDFMSGLKISK